MQALALPPGSIAWDVGSLWADLQTPAHVAGPLFRQGMKNPMIVLLDGSQFASAMEAPLNATFSTPDGYANPDCYVGSRRCSPPRATLPWWSRQPWNVLDDCRVLAEARPRRLLARARAALISWEALSSTRFTRPITHQVG
jgi:hypothetical protein